MKKIKTISMIAGITILFAGFFSACEKENVDNTTSKIVDQQATLSQKNFWVEELDTDYYAGEMVWDYSTNPPTFLGAWGWQVFTQRFHYVLESHITYQYDSEVQYPPSIYLILNNTTPGIVGELTIEDLQNNYAVSYINIPTGAEDNFLQMTVDLLNGGN